MRIAVLGWGSLIWCPRGLRIKDGWDENGPYLPVEFAHKSQDGRLTLVIFPQAEKVQVLWAYMEHSDLEDAKENLKEREETAPKNIGYVIVGSGESRSKVPSIANDVKRWASGRDIDAVIWTDLEPDFEKKTKKPFTEENVIKYLKNLDCPAKEAAEKYIRRAPLQIKTHMRAVIESELGWKPEEGGGGCARCIG